ncbi:hypothetical protein C9422_08370 [Pseudomonas sp. B1(2018)]|nr:hypothetical protein C9422_08370 [Pseudomonas sp. B1(2018)]
MNLLKLPAKKHQSDTPAYIIRLQFPLCFIAVLWHPFTEFRRGSDDQSFVTHQPQIDLSSVKPGRLDG